MKLLFSILWLVTAGQGSIPEPAWDAMNERQVSIELTNGRSYRGQMVGHDEQTVTILNDQGTIAVLEKSDVAELRGVQLKQATPRSDSAAPPARVFPPDFQRTRPFLNVSPGVVSIFFDSPQVPLYTWGLGAGAFIRPRGKFAMAAGGSFEHFSSATSQLDKTTGYVFGTKFNAVRFLAEMRIGVASDRVFGYGLARFGLALYHSRLTRTGTSTETLETGLDYG